MIIECPHCYRTISPMRGAECPACHRDVNQPPLGADQWTVVVVDANTKMPKSCCLCGEETQGSTRISSSQSYRGSGGAAPSARSVFMVVTGILLMRPFRCFRGLAYDEGGPKEKGTSGSKVNVSYRIPICGSCSRQHAEVKPLRIDYDYQNMEFRVHVDFGTQFRELNGLGKPPIKNSRQTAIQRPASQGSQR